MQAAAHIALEEAAHKAQQLCIGLLVHCPIGVVLSPSKRSQIVNDEVPWMVDHLTGRDLHATMQVLTVLCATDLLQRPFPMISSHWGATWGHYFWIPCCSLACTFPFMDTQIICTQMAHELTYPMRS